ncbi:MAG: histidine phosphatase family protein [Oceanicaulis sp.]
MPRLIVMRHAKAVDRLEAEDDFERGLTESGRADAARAGDAVKAAGLTADYALVSPARRTRETFRVISERVGEPPVTDPMALYHASTEMLERAVLTALSDGAQSIVLVGHNPGVGGFAHSLAAAAQSTKDMPPGWPTSALAAFDIAPAGERVTASRRLMLFDPKA